MQAHRLVWMVVHGEFPGDMIDHINGNPTDNRIENLRVVTHSVNMQNRRTARSTNKTGLLGVSVSGSKFSAEIRIDGTQVCLGRFETAQMAHEAYVNAKRTHHIGCTI